MKSAARIAGLLAATLILASCGWFAEEDEELQPNELRPFDERIKVKRLWSGKVGGGSESLLLGLRPVGDGNRIYAASYDGNVVAFDPVSGKIVWKTELDMELSAGPGTGEGTVAVVGKDGFVILLDARDGAEQWRQYVGAESLAQPLIRDDLVIVQTIDNRLQSLSRFDGRQRWEIEQSMPALTMRGASSPLLVGSSVIAGFDNGRLVAVDASSGDVEWDSLLAVPTGRSDLDRLSDIDGSLAVVGQDLYAAGYQGRVASIAAESGQVLWQRDISSHVGVSADWNSVYTARTDGEVIAMSRRAGTESWRNDDLLRREPTLPVPYRNTVVVGDFEGYVHFFSGLDGTAVARLRLGSDAISAEPVVVADRLYIQGDGGSIAAYEIVDETPQRDAPDIADES